MKIISLNFKQKRFGWKDWFIQEPPSNTEKLHIWLEKQFSFDIDPLFEIFEIEGILTDTEPAFVMNYIFTDERILERVYCTSFFRTKKDIYDNIRHFDITIRKNNALDI